MDVGTLIPPRFAKPMLLLCPRLLTCDELLPDVELLLLSEQETWKPAGGCARRWRSSESSRGVFGHLPDGQLAMNSRPEWAILAPMDSATLQAEFNRLATQAFDAASAWMPISGESEYSGIGWYRPGDDGLGEEFSECLSAAHAGVVYVLYLDPDHQTVLAFEGGRGTGSLPDHPLRLAARLGCQLPVEWVEATPALNRSVCVVPGASREQVARVFGLDTPPVQGPLHIEDLRNGGVGVYSDCGGIGIFMDDLSEAFDGPVYCLTGDSERFTCGPRVSGRRARGRCPGPVEPRWHRPRTRD
jgi:hypothetical protein